MMRVLRWLLAGLVLVVGILAVSYMQQRFDEGDKKKALQAVLVKWPELTGCEAEVVSRVWGEVRVRCTEGQWLVDVVKGVIGEDYGK